MDEYIKLVEDVAKKYSTPILGGYYKKDKQDPFYLKWCDECKEINLWTYWQGRNNKEAEILLIGQDWASAWKDGLLLDYLSEVLKSDVGCSERYIAAVEKNSSPTDVMLRDLLLSLGKKYDPFTADNKNLFFTNLCLGYRDHGVSGSLGTKCLEDDVEYIERLISIVKPKLVICLGKDTFDAFVKKTKITLVGEDKSFSA